MGSRFFEVAHRSLFDLLFPYVSFLRIFCGIQKLMVLWNSVSKCGLRSVFENIGPFALIPQILRAHDHASFIPPLLTCPTLLYSVPTFLIVTNCAGLILPLYWEEGVLIQYLCCHHSNPAVVMLIPYFPDREFSVTIIAQLTQTQVIFLARHTFSWAFSHFVLETHAQILRESCCCGCCCWIACFLPFYHYICCPEVKCGIFWVINVRRQIQGQACYSPRKLQSPL